MPMAAGARPEAERQGGERRERKGHQGTRGSRQRMRGEDKRQMQCAWVGQG